MYNIKIFLHARIKEKRSCCKTEPAEGVQFLSPLLKEAWSRSQSGNSELALKLALVERCAYATNLSKYLFALLQRGKYKRLFLKT